jgi:hypothetical protein
MRVKSGEAASSRTHFGNLPFSLIPGASASAALIGQEKWKVNVAVRRGFYEVLSSKL